MILSCNALSGDPPYQMLELQLAMFIEFPGRMNPGIFVVASDCLELFNSEGDWSFTKPGFTALAHPSPINIGTTHGVFVLSDHNSLASVEVITLSVWFRVVHFWWLQLGLVYTSDRIRVRVRIEIVISIMTQ